MAEKRRVISFLGHRPGEYLADWWWCREGYAQRQWVLRRGVPGCFLSWLMSEKRAVGVGGGQMDSWFWWLVVGQREG